MTDKNYAPEELIAAARDLYEGTHQLTMADLAEMTGISVRVLRQARRDQNWQKALETKTGATTEAALAAANVFRERQLAPIVAKAPAAGSIAEEDVKALIEPLPAEVDEVLKRHRDEWKAPRAMVVESVRMRDSDPFKSFERAKLAKITAETLKIVQDGERKAHGIDVGTQPPPGKHVVIIERD